MDEPLLAGMQHSLWVESDISMESENRLHIRDAPFDASSVRQFAENYISPYS